MAGTSGGGSGSGGGDNNEERLKKMVADHLRASELFAIDTRTPEGLASLTAILGQALQVGLAAGEAQREEEARKAAEAKKGEARSEEEGGGEEEAPFDNIGRGGNSNRTGIHWGQEHH
ncbi:unnamed protein product [Sphagnum jensenii]|uniref:Uncharacterized protein n=1 Tax=Sphagnum jensenii TaxID=128206 RepID=A0ABP0VZB5_9BRYO